MLWAALLANFLQTSSFSDASWRWAVFTIGIAFFFLTIGLGAWTVYFFRRRIDDRTALYFGVFVILYAVRMLLREPPFLSVFGISVPAADHIDRAITTIIAVPILLLFLAYVQARWRRIIQWIIAVQLMFAVIAISCDLVGIARHAMDITNSILVLSGWVLALLFLFFLRNPGPLPSDLRVVLVGIGVDALFVLHANLVGLRIIPGRDVEPLGFLVFVFSLGYLVVHRIFEKEESLFAIQKELQIAEQIQTSILPREIPCLPGIEIASRYIPMSAVAGDFYDFLELEGNQLGILIADVTGHGVPAALIASMLKVAFAVQINNAGNPGQVLSGINRALCGKFESHFVTAAYLYLNLDERIVRYAGAGHPPLLCSNRGDETTRLIAENGLILGMFPEASYSALELSLKAGDRYVLYTDGLPETKNAGEEEFGILRCERFLKSNTALATRDFADQLLREISLWSARSTGRSQEDDMTLIVIDCDSAP
jgi:phosphoserine phosphatase RsbU/P